MDYNKTLIFAVPKNLLNKALGEQGRNIKKMSEILGTKVKIIPSPRGIHDVKPFIENIIKPVTFKSLDVKGNEMIITAGSQSKAMLIGRNKQRLIELQRIVKDYFGKELKII
jgi:transcription antitermination factor NusA-like protein